VKNLKVVFLDFTGTIDAIWPPAKEYTSSASTVAKTGPARTTYTYPSGVKITSSKAPVYKVDHPYYPKRVGSRREEYQELIEFERAGADSDTLRERSERAVRLATYPKTSIPDTRPRDSFGNLLYPSYQPPAPRRSHFYDNIDDGQSFKEPTPRALSIIHGFGSYFERASGYCVSALGLGKGKSSYVYGPNKECVRLLRKLLDKTGAKIVYSSTRRSSGWKSCAEYLGLPLKYSLGYTHPEMGCTPDLPSRWDYLRKDVASAGTEVNDGWFHKWPEDRTWDDPLPSDLDPEVGTQAVTAPITETQGDGTVYYGWKEREKEIQKWLDTWKDKGVVNYAILDDDEISGVELNKHWAKSVKKNGFLEAGYKEAISILSGKKA